jgi:ABC-type transporter Mla subunit MlaD
MDDAHEERFRQHEDILRSLTAMLAAQHAMNERVEGFMLRQDTLNAQQAGINERLTAAIERLDVTQARIETLLARMLPPGENGRDA